MAGIHDYWLFVASAILLNIAPGQDTLYILGRSVAQGRRVGVAAALGVSAGTVVHTFAAALGLSAILATSATAFFVVKLLGAAYLVYLGVCALWKPAIVAPSDRPIAAADAAKAFRQGLLTNVLNPKVALFFLAFLPQFVDADAPAKTTAFLALGLTFVTTGTAWVLVLAVASARLRRWLDRYPGAQAWIVRTMGGLFVFLGIRLALADK